MRRLFNLARLKKLKVFKDSKLLWRFRNGLDGGKVGAMGLGKMMPGFRLEKGSISLFGDKEPKGFGRFNKDNKGKKNKKDDEDENGKEEF